ncbi:MAG: DUF748 domain-containing protein, partial [Deltaproteobacteria bacterium]|nr:DUF748 domain-containing protein [Deltaproteobacteria bacterium]
MRRYSRLFAWSLGALAALGVALVAAALLVQEPLRRRMEGGMNAALEGYSVRLPRLRLHPLKLGVSLKGLTLRQDAHPEPPVARFPRLTAGLHWGEILTGHVVAEFALDRPQLYVNVRQLREEREDETPVTQRGWQAAVKQIYPFEVNRLEVRDAELVYVDEDVARPLRVTRLELSATNIRNLDSPDRTYPSPVRLRCAVFGSGRCELDGRANFLSEPHPGIQADLRLADIPLEPFRPVLERANFRLQGGVFSSSGRVEYAPKEKFAWLRQVALRGLALDYVHRTETAEAERRRVRKAKEAARTATQEVGLRVRVDELGVT